MLISTFLFFLKKDQWLFGVKREETLDYYSEIVNPTIKSVNEFLACVFPNLLILPLTFWTSPFNPVSWLMWSLISDTVKKTQKDGTDRFFLIFATPISRERIFWGKLFFLVSSLVSLHLIIFALPFSLLLWRTGYFSNFTGTQVYFFLFWNFLVTSLFVIAPLVIFFSSLAFVSSFWYDVMKLPGWFFSLIPVILKKVVWIRGERFLKWLNQHYLLTTLIIVGVIITLALFFLRVAYKNFRKKDFV